MAHCDFQGELFSRHSAGVGLDRRKNVRGRVFRAVQIGFQTLQAVFHILNHIPHMYLCGQLFQDVQQHLSLLFLPIAFAGMKNGWPLQSGLSRVLQYIIAKVVPNWERFLLFAKMEIKSWKCEGAFLPKTLQGIPVISMKR